MDTLLRASIVANPNKRPTMLYHLLTLFKISTPSICDQQHAKNHVTIRSKMSCCSIMGNIALFYVRHYDEQIQYLYACDDRWWVQLCRIFKSHCKRLHKSIVVNITHVCVSVCMMCLLFRATTDIFFYHKFKMRGVWVKKS